MEEYHEMFVSAVARNRGVTPLTVRKKFGEGRVFGAEQAVELGMADRIGTFDSTLAKYSGVSGKKSEEIESALVVAEVDSAPVLISVQKHLRKRFELEVL